MVLKAQSSLLPAGTNLGVGDPAPPTTSHKAASALLWGLGPVVLGALIAVLGQVGALFPGSPPWVLNTCAAILVVLGPIASYIGTYRKPNQLLQPVIVAPGRQLPPLPAPVPLPVPVPPTQSASQGLAVMQPPSPGNG